MRIFKTLPPRGALSVAHVEEGILCVHGGSKVYEGGALVWRVDVAVFFFVFDLYGWTYSV